MRLGFVIFVFFWTQLSWALGTNGGSVDAFAFSQYYIDTSRQKSIEEIKALDAKAWTPVNVEAGNFGFQEQIFWFKVVIPACSYPLEARVLEVAYPLLDSIEFWSYANQIRQYHYKTGDNLPAHHRPYQHLHFGFPLSCDPGLTAYLRVSTEGIMQVPLKIWPEIAFITHSYRRELPQIFYLGAMLMMAVYNILILFTTRRMSYLFYVLHTISIVSFQAGLSGIGFRYVWPNSPLVNQFVIDKSITLMVLSALAFGASYLDFRKISPRLHRLVVRSCLLLFAYFMASFALPYHLSLRMSIAWVAYGISLGIYMIAKNLQKGRHTKFWSLTWLFLLVGAIALLVSRTGVVPRNTIMENSMQIASVLVSAFLSYALADQLNLLRFDLARSNTELEKTLESIETIVQEKTENIRTIMNTLQQGIVTVRSDKLLIEPEYSRATADILGHQALEGTRLEKVLLERLNLGTDVRLRAVSALQFSLHEDLISFELNAPQLPQEAQINTSRGIRDLVIDWVPILKDNLVDRYLVAFRDVTELKILQSAQKKQSEMLNKLQQIVDSDVHVLRKFLHQADHIAQYHLYLPAGILFAGEEMQSIFVYVHTLKGESRSLGLLELSEACHELEDIYDSMRSDPGSWNSEVMARGLDKVKSSLMSYKHIYQENIGHLITEDDVVIDQSILIRWKDKLNVLMVHDRREREALRPILQEIYNILYLSFDAYKVKLQVKIRRIALDLGLLEPELRVAGDILYLQPDLVELLDRCFIHIFQNSLVHGIEPQALRRERGKSPVGSISVAISRRPFFVRLTIEDDGAGIQVEKIRQKATALGFIQADQKLDTETIKTCILRSGFSSADAVTSHAGRGLGLDAIRHFVSEFEGQFNLQFGAEVNGHRSMQLLIDLPSHLFPEVPWQNTDESAA